MSRLFSVVVPIVCLSVLLVVAVGPAPPQAQSSLPATPSELVGTYDTLADAILAVKGTEANLVRSILATTHAHAEAVLDRAVAAVDAGNSASARASLEQLAALVAQIGTEGDNAVAGIRKRLVEGGHHHNAEGETKGIYDPGFVIVTRAAKKALLDASSAIGKLSRAPNKDTLMGEWKKVQTAWEGLMKEK